MSSAIATKKYDAGGRVTEEIDPLGMFTKYFYNTNDGKLQQTQVGKYQLDADGKLILDADNNPVVDTNVEIRTWNYEYNGTNTTVIDPIGRRTTSITDDYYLPTETIYQLRNGEIYSEKAEYLYDNNLQEAKDYPTKVIDIGNNDRVFEYDDFGRLKTATDLADNTYTYNYGDDGLELITSPEGETRKYGYDELGNLTSTTYEDNTVTEMTYRESDNRLETVELHSGETITYDYNDAGQITNQTSSNSGTVSFTYTSEGAVETMTDSTGINKYRYDDSNRLEGIDYPDGNSISYEYDFVGRIKKVKEKTSARSPEYVTEYDYDAFGNLSLIKDPNGGVSTIKYDVVNRLQEWELANGVKTTYEYDDLDRVKSIVHTNANGDVLASVAYERVGIGEPSKITREDGSYVELEYDDALRVEKESRYSVDGTLIEEITYSYDADGRRKVESSSVSRDSNYTYDGYQLDTVQNAGVTENYDYDDNGRLTLIERDGETVDLEHDTYDRLTEVENQTTGETTQYIYDGNGNRVKAVEGTDERRFLVAPAMGGGLQSTDLIADENGNLISNYIYGGGSSPFMRLDESGNAVYYLTDAMGTVIGLADGSGESAGTFIYDAFGEVLNGSSVAGETGGDFRFQGQWLEEDSGLYHFRARDYDPETGLFLSRDAVDLIETEPESFNPYQFVYNNPLVYSDPTGMVTISEIQATLNVQNILRSIETRTKQEIYERFKDKAVETAGEVFWSVLRKFTPLNSPLTDAIRSVDNALGAGLDFEKKFKEQVRDTFAEAGINLDQVFLEVGVTEKGQATGNWINFPNIEGNPRAGELRPDYVLTPPGNQPRGRWGTQTLGGPQRSYLIGDIKLQLKTIVRDYVNDNGKAPRKPQQWNAIANYARKNGSRVAGFVTLFGDSQRGREESLEQIAQKAAIKKGFVIFIVSILDKVPYSRKP